MQEAVPFPFVIRRRLTGADPASLPVQVAAEMVAPVLTVFGAVREVHTDRCGPTPKESVSCAGPRRMTAAHDGGSARCRPGISAPVRPSSA